MKKLFHCFTAVFAAALLFLCIFQFVIILTRTVWVDGRFSFMPYYEVFLGTPQYLERFWKSLSVCGCIVAGQVLVSVLAGYGFAKCSFPGRNLIFFCLMILMVLPLQVTLIPNYMILNQLNLLGKNAALIYPAIFVPLGTFLMTQSFRTIPDELLSAARLDGCGIFRLLGRMALPMNRGTVICVALLSFLDAWNMVEQPISYMKRFEQYPISVALAYVSGNPLHQFVCCLLVLLPPLFFFSCFHRELADGIIIGEEK